METVHDTVCSILALFQQRLDWSPPQQDGGGLAGAEVVETVQVRPNGGRLRIAILAFVRTTVCT